MLWLAGCSDRDGEASAARSPDNAGGDTPATQASAPVAVSSSHAQEAEGAESITTETAISRLKRNPIIMSAIEQAEAFAGTKNCDFEFERLRELTQFEPGSAFEYTVRITCGSKNGEYEAAALIEAEGQSLNYGEPVQAIQRLSFHVAG